MSSHSRCWDYCNRRRFWCRIVRVVDFTQPSAESEFAHGLAFEKVVWESQFDTAGLIETFQVFIRQGEVSAAQIVFDL